MMSDVLQVHTAEHDRSDRETAAAIAVAMALLMDRLCRRARRCRFGTQYVALLRAQGTTPLPPSGGRPRSSPMALMPMRIKVGERWFSVRVGDITYSPVEVTVEGETISVEVEGLPNRPPPRPAGERRRAARIVAPPRDRRAASRGSLRQDPPQPHARQGHRYHGAARSACIRRRRSVHRGSYEDGTEHPCHSGWHSSRHSCAAHGLRRRPGPAGGVRVTSPGFPSPRKGCGFS